MDLSSSPGRGAAIGEAISRLSRISARAKHEMVQRDPALRDVAVMVVLATLVERGPQRSATLAGCLHLDPSQVSRNVATAVRDGLIERRIDPADGRAVQLVPTVAGAQRYREFARARAAHLDEVVADWDSADIESFAGYLDRFVASFEEHFVNSVAEHSVSSSDEEVRATGSPDPVGGRSVREPVLDTVS